MKTDKQQIEQVVKTIREINTNLLNKSDLTEREFMALRAYLFEASSQLNQFLGYSKTIKL